MVNDVRQKMGDAADRVRERRTEGRLDDLDRENVRLRTEVSQLRGDLDHERSLVNDAMNGLRAKPTVVKKKRRGGLIRTVVVAGGAYLLGTRAGRERYDQIMGWVDRKRAEVKGHEDEWSGDPVADQPAPALTPKPKDPKDLQRS